MNGSAPVAARGGVELVAERWLPAKRVRAHVVYVHGLGEHRRALPYVPFYERLAAAGYAVLAFDLRGHGESGGARLYARDFAVVDEDLRRVIALAADEAQGRPVFVVGGSFGGLLALASALRPHESLAGVIAAAPALDASGASKAMRRLLPVFRRVVPRLRLDPGLDLAALAHDTAAVEAYRADPRMQLGRITPALAAATLAGIDRVMKQADEVDLPLLLLHGLDDRIVPPDGTLAFHALAASPDKSLVTLPGALHHLLLDDTGPRVTREILDWLEARTVAER
jgi:lysophospholipase